MFEQLTLSYIIDFFRFLVANKRGELVRFILVTFLLSLLPYIIVSLSLWNATDIHKRGYYGDGSILTLCAGIMCSYLTMLFDFNFKKPNDKTAVRTSIVIILMLVFYVLITVLFAFCQNNFDRNKGFIVFVVSCSTILLILTFFASCYLQFIEKVTPNEVINFAEERQRIKIENKTKKPFSSQEGTAV